MGGRDARRTPAGRRRYKNHKLPVLSAIGFSRGIVQGDQLPWGVILCGQRIFWIGVLYGQDLSAADTAKNQILLVNGDNPVLLVEYRIVVHSP